MFLGRLLVVRGLLANDDVVDGDEHQLDHEADEAHDGETHGASHGDLLELLGVGLGALLHEALGRDGEVFNSVDLGQNKNKLI